MHSTELAKGLDEDGTPRTFRGVLRFKPTLWIGSKVVDYEPRRSMRSGKPYYRVRYDKPNLFASFAWQTFAMLYRLHDCQEIPVEWIEAAFERDRYNVLVKQVKGPDGQLFMEAQPHSLCFVGGKEYPIPPLVGNVPSSSALRYPDASR